MRLSVVGALYEMGTVDTVRPTVRENAAKARAAVRLVRTDGQGSLIIIGLTEEEVRKLAPAFMEDIAVNLTTSR